MVKNFNRVKKIASTSGGNTHIKAINGCCYGIDHNPVKESGYEKLCGQKFWELITGDEDFYLKIIEPLGHQAKNRNDNFSDKYAVVKNKFVAEFIKDFCTNGEINWAKLVRLASAAKENDTPLASDGSL